MARRLAHAFGEAVVSLRRGWQSTILALAAIVSATFVLGTFLIGSGVIDDAVERSIEAAELSVFLREGIAGGERQAIERALDASGLVRERRFVTADEARRRFEQSFPDLAPLVGSQSDTPLPASVEARLRPDATVAGVTGLAGQLRALPGVADVRVDRDLLDRLLAAARAGRLVGGVLAAILVCAAALAIASVVRLSYVARRDEVDVLYLLGAPLAAIRGPFVAEGALQAALGTGVALALLAVAYRTFVQSAAGRMVNIPVRFLPGWLIAALIGGGIVVGALSALVAVRAERHDVIG